jgi:hypothetical protein
LAIANLLAERDSEITKQVLNQTFIIDLLDSLIIKPRKHLKDKIPFLVRMVMDNLLFESEIQSYQAETPTGICLRVLSANYQLFGQKWLSDSKEL